MTFTVLGAVVECSTDQEQCSNDHENPFYADKDYPKFGSFTFRTFIKDDCSLIIIKNLKIIENGFFYEPNTFTGAQ